MIKKLAFPLICTLSLMTCLTHAQGNQPASWRFQKDQDNKCVARYLANSGVELMPQKLTISTKETSDLKAFQVSINGQVVAPMSRANLTDMACKCIRIRNTSTLTTEEVNVRIQGQTSTDAPIDATFNIKDVPAALNALKSDTCTKAQK